MELRSKRIYITDTDRQRLMQFLPPQGRPAGEHLRALRAGLEEATVVSDEHVPDDVVTLGRRFRIRDLETEDEAEYMLVLPDRADIKRGYISILAPIGASLLGAQAQETITFSTPASTRRLRIESIACRAEVDGVA